MRIELEHVHFMPKELQPGILYVSKEFGAVAHLCPCGCATKVRTPLGPTEWSLDETTEGPSLFPSVGNWQLPCQAHYWIQGGEVVWAEQWTPSQIAASRRAEQVRRSSYFAERPRSTVGLPQRLWNWIARALAR